MATTRVILGSAALALAAVTGAAQAASASTASRRGDAYVWATHQRGCWYEYGAAGPCGNGYDCSGLVMAAYNRVGIHLPHNTVQMLNSGKLTRVSSSSLHRGDLAFYGSGHVELVRWAHETLGALEQGTRVAFHRWYPSSGWEPTSFYHVNGSG